MAYIVHVFGQAERYRFDEFPKAFQMFKLSSRYHRGVALWHGKCGKWVRVYATDGYPEAYRRPFQEL